MDIQQMDRVIKQAKLWIQQNRPPQEEEFWVDHNGEIRKIPFGMFFDAKADMLKFKK